MLRGFFHARPALFDAVRAQMPGTVPIPRAFPRAFPSCHRGAEKGGGSPFAGSDRETTSRRGAVMACMPRLHPKGSCPFRRATSDDHGTALVGPATGNGSSRTHGMERNLRSTTSPRGMARPTLAHPEPHPFEGCRGRRRRIVWVRRLSTMARQRRCALICKTSDCYGFGPNRPLKPFALPPPIGESRTDDGSRGQLEAGNNPGARQEAGPPQGHAPCDQAPRTPVQRTGPSTASDGPCSAGRPGLCRPRFNREDVRTRTRPNHARPAFGHAPERTSGSRPNPSPPCANPARKRPRNRALARNSSWE